MSLENLDTRFLDFPQSFFGFAVNPEHEYELTLAGWVTAWDAKHVVMNAAVEIMVVPEPTTTFLLFAGALGLLVHRLRRAGASGR